MADGNSGGGEAHVNPQDAEVVDLGGGLGEKPAQLPPPASRRQQATTKAERRASRMPRTQQPQP